MAHDQFSIDRAWDFYECKNHNALAEIDARGKVAHIIKNSGFTFIDDCFHKFGEGGEGYSYVAIIGESHVAIHTWPERGAAEVTLHYCNFTQNNDDKAEKLFGLLKEYFATERINPYNERRRCAA